MQTELTERVRGTSGTKDVSGTDGVSGMLDKREATSERI